MNFLFDLYGTLADIHTDEGKDSLWRGFALYLGEDDAFALKDEYHSICKRYSDMMAHRFIEFDLLLVFEEMLESRGISKEKAPEAAMVFRRLSREKLKLFPYVLEMLDLLRARGAGVYLVSNAQSCFTRGELMELGLTEHFDGILISSEAGVKKPDRAIFEKAAEIFGIDLCECVYVGNDLHDDVLGAQGAGLMTVYIQTEQSGSYPQLDVLPDYVVSTHEEMMERLFSLAG